MHQFEIILALLVAVVLLGMAARRLGVPSPVLLVIGGLVIALFPGLPPVEFEPRLIFVVFIPPLLYRAALAASWRDPRANVRPITLLAVGLVVAWLIAWLRRRIHAPEIEATISLLTPFAAFFPAEALGVSGVLAVVACGLYLGRQGPRIVAPDTRVQTEGMCGVIGFVLEGLTFIFVGLELRTVLGTLGAYSVRQLALAGVAVSLARSEEH